MYLPDNTIYTPLDEINEAKERTLPATLPMERRMTSFDEIEDTYTEEEAHAESMRCLNCPTHWCANQCPIHNPIPQFIAKIREGDYEGAYQLLAANSALPEFCSRVCPQQKQCQSDCTRSLCAEAVSIGRLERFAVERHFASVITSAPRVPSTGKQVAVVGSGPSGLAAAERLAQKGHAVTVFEKNDRVGGLTEYGIPNMKLEKGVVERRRRALEALGVSFRTGVEAGKDVSADELKKNYDAVVLALGAGNPRSLAMQGGEEVRSGVCYAVDFLRANTKSLLDSGLADGKNISAAGKDVVVVGGGDTGNDCVGTALRHGCRSLTQVEMLPEKPLSQIIHTPFPEPQRDFTPSTSQVEAKEKFGRDPHVWQATVKSVETDGDGALKSVTLVHLLPVPAPYGRKFTMQEIPGSEETIPCQLLVVAAGFLGPRPEYAKAFGVETDRRSNLAAEKGSYATSVPGVFACGDCRSGQSLVIRAMSEGEECAAAVDACLR